MKYRKRRSRVISRGRIRRRHSRSRRIRRRHSRSRRIRSRRIQRERRSRMKGGKSIEQFREDALRPWNEIERYLILKQGGGSTTVNPGNDRTSEDERVKILELDRVGYIGTIRDRLQKTQDRIRLIKNGFLQTGKKPLVDCLVRLGSTPEDAVQIIISATDEELSQKREEYMETRRDDINLKMRLLRQAVIKTSRRRTKNDMQLMEEAGLDSHQEYVEKPPSEHLDDDGNKSDKPIHRFKVFKKGQ